MTNGHACCLMNLKPRTVIPTPCAFHHVRNYCRTKGEKSNRDIPDVKKKTKKEKWLPNIIQIFSSFLDVLMSHSSCFFQGRSTFKSKLIVNKTGIILFFLIRNK